MVAVFFTFALSGPLPPKEMGVILGVSVLLDAMLVRLVLLPALMRAFGRHAWALPRRLGPDAARRPLRALLMAGRPGGATAGLEPPRVAHQTPGMSRLVCLR